ncbi:MAG: response regulator [Candidatus Riflebacteria bacterium]|nr:response regulator [Candidatus Riflebacteria bacterium]
MLTDVIMPGMSGVELIERIRRIRPEVRSLYLTGYAEEQLAPHGVLDHGCHLLEKPVRVEVLAREVRRALDR